jgi:SAM-dependent methyltransferase
MTFYTQFAETYDAIFPFSEAVYAFLRRHLPDAPARVLDVGCGTGLYAAALASDGYDAVGIDLDAAMIARAQVRQPEAAFHVLNMLDIATLGRAFAGVMCIGNSAAHLTQREFSEFVAAVAQARLPGAPWILQVMNWDYVLTQEQVSLPVIEGKDGAVFHRTYREIRPSQVTFATRLEVERRVLFEETVPLYPLRSAEIVACHQERGFDLIEHAGSYGGAAFDPDIFSANIFVFR